MLRRCNPLRRHRPVVSFLSDIEGSLPYWNKFLKISKVLCREERTGNVIFRDGNDRCIETPTSHFVFGGDAFDKGCGDLAVARELVALKKRYPDRVTLLLGNRDINKMKLTSELQVDFVTNTAKSKEQFPIPYYIVDESLCKPLQQYLDENKLPNDQVSRLKWLLDYTMGCQDPSTFELRRQEVANERGIPQKHLSSVTDREVLQSFLDSVLKEDGDVRQYLKHAELAKVIDGAIFVHGAVNDRNIGFVPDAEALEEYPYRAKRLPVPGHSMLDDPTMTVDNWVDALNDFAQHQVVDWEQHMFFEPRKYFGKERGTPGPRGGSALLAYPQLAAMGRCTIVTSCFIDNGALGYVDLATVQYLNSFGINTVLAGHQPSGDTPSIVRQPGLTTIVADNSYCCMGKGCGDNRGDAVTEVLYFPDHHYCGQAHTGGFVKIHGVFMDGEAFSFDVLEDGSEAIADSPRIDCYTFDHDVDRWLGKRSSSGWWCKAYRPSPSGSDKEFLVQYSNNQFFNVEYKWLSRNDMSRLFSSSNGSGGNNDGDAGVGVGGGETLKHGVGGFTDDLKTLFASQPCGGTAAGGEQHTQIKTKRTRAHTSDSSSDDEKKE